jgi:predicted transposase YbfD/YdcC
MDVYRLKEELRAVHDPRREWGNLRHKLVDILIISLCSTICGGEDFEDMELFGRERHAWLKTFLELPSGIPDGDTFRRVLERIDPAELAAVLYSCLEEIKDLSGKTVSIDGKTICGSGSAQHKAYHVVSAWVSENQMVLGEVVVDKKSNEITVIPRLLDMIDVSGSVVTIDAMGTQTKIAAKIVEKGADYVLALKGNHSDLHDDVRFYFENETISNRFSMREMGHGRQELREYFLETKIDWLYGCEKWAGLQAIGAVKSTVTEKGVTREETRYFLTSLTDVKHLARAVRGHWGIENGLHWCLDVIFGEDCARMRKERSPLNMNVLRKTALALLRKTKVGRMSAKHKMFKAAMNHDFLHLLMFVE